MNSIVVIFLLLASIVRNSSPKIRSANIVIVMDESRIFYKHQSGAWIDQYWKLHGFLNDIFDVDYAGNSTRVWYLCTGYNGFGNTPCGNTDEWRNFPKNLNLIFNEILRVVFDMSDRKWTNGPNITIVFTDGDMTEEQLKFPENLEHLRDSNNFFFFYSRLDSTNASESEIAQMEEITMVKDNVIKFDRDDLNTTKEKFLNALKWTLSPTTTVTTTIASSTEPQSEKGEVENNSTKGEKVAKPGEDGQGDETGKDGSNVGLIVNTVCGIVVLLIIIVVVAIVFIRRSKSKKESLKKGKTAGESSVRAKEKGRDVAANISAWTCRSVTKKSMMKKGNLSTKNSVIQSTFIVGKKSAVPQNTTHRSKSVASQKKTKH